MMDLKALETFVRVAELGSFRAAANKLHTTQPAISQRIAQLESELGARLLERERRNVTPTPRGRTLLAYAEKMLALRAEMLTVFSDSTSLRGVMRIGLAETIVHTWLTRFLKQVNAIHPHLGLEIEVDISPNLRDRLAAQELDVVFMLGPSHLPLMENRLLCSYPVSFVASPEISWSQKPVTLEELATFPIITFSRNTQPYMAVRTLFSRHDLPPVRLHASASLSTVVHMATEGLGIAVIPAAIVSGELASGRLAVIETNTHIPDLPFYAAWTSTPDSSAARQIVEIAAVIAQERGGM
ncbi:MULTISPECIES: LysR family transcriptional regulator [Azorhizobium]|uniref:LysR family transcriptional regulator n=1 Tax=Azorhizobium caulinodans TaxID=7 RepID=UPI0005C718BA